MKKIILILTASLFICPLFAEKILFSASSMTGQTGDSSNSTTRLIGNAFIQTETMEITADVIELSGEDYRFIKADGNVVGKNTESKMDFTCNSMNYDRDTKVALLEGNVELTDLENDVNASAQRIEYNQDTDVAVLQIQVNLKQKENVCSGSYAIYQKKLQLLEISGNAQVKQKEDTFRAQQITFNMETEDITLSGNVKGSVVDNGKKENSDKKNDSKMAVKPAEKANEVVVDESTKVVENNEKIEETSETKENESVAEKNDNVVESSEKTNLNTSNRLKKLLGTE